MPIPEVTCQTGISRSALYKLWTKAISCGWMPEKVVETWHVDDALRSGKLKISISTVLLVIEIIVTTLTVTTPTTRLASPPRANHMASDTVD